MKPITVLFFGSQGAGKGTQVQMLVDYLKSKSDRGVIRIDMGHELRELRDERRRRLGRFLEERGRTAEAAACLQGKE